MIRVLLGGIVGGIVLFVWGFVTHVALPVGEMGISTLPNDAVVLASMRENIREPGLYLMPGYDMSKPLSEAEQKAWADRYVAGPTAFLVYHPTGDQPMSPRQLGFELLTNVVCGLLIAFVLSLTTTSYVGRVAVSTLMGFFGWVAISASYWNWYGFPGAFIAAEGIEQAGGGLVAGLVLAAIVKPKAA